MTLLFKLLHILAAIWFFSGIIGRGVTFAQAGRSENVHSAYALLRASDSFERRMVIGVIVYRFAELVVVVTITALMVLKPF